MLLNLLLNFVGWCNFFQTPIIILLTVVIGYIAVKSLYFARRSLQVAHRSFEEAEKTRRDTFLPVIILIKDPVWCSEFSPNKSSLITLKLRNCGHGFAFRVIIALTGVKKIQKIVPVIDNMGQIEPFKIDLLNTKLQTKLLSKAELMIEYKDVFKRTVKTIYEVTQREHIDDQSNEFYEPVVDATNYEVKLPD